MLFKSIYSSSKILTNNLKLVNGCLSNIISKINYSTKNEDDKIPTLEEVKFKYVNYNVLDHVPVSEDIINSSINDKMFYELPIINIRTHNNNTKLCLSDFKGKCINYFSCGSIGFVKGERSTTVAMQSLGLTVGYKALNLGYTHVRVVLMGGYTNITPCVLGIGATGLKVVSLTENTQINYGLGMRPRKPKRR